MERKEVAGYPDAVREKEELILKTYEYVMPFNYANVEVKRKYKGDEFHGVELNPMNAVNPEDDISGDVIVITEDEPIVKVVVIGSACTPPGYVQIEAEPCADFRRPNEVSEVMPVRFRINGLWGMHLRLDQWCSGECSPFGPIPEVYHKMWPHFMKPQGGLKSIYQQFPMTGMSCAVFEIPKSRKVHILGGSEIPGWSEDNSSCDAHYSFRIIRTTVALSQRPVRK